MQRRPFIKAAAASLATMLGASASEAAPDPSLIARVFRKGPDGKYWEIDRHDVKKGDEIVLIGIDDGRHGRLGQIRYFKAAGDYYDDGIEHGATAVAKSYDFLQLVDECERGHWVRGHWHLPSV